MSDFDDIFILFMKMQSESCSRLGSKHQRKIFCNDVIFMYSLTNTKNLDKKKIIMVILPAKSDVSGLTEKGSFFAFWIDKWHKHNNCCS